MNINSRPRIIVYLLFFFLLSYLLFKEYTYVVSYKDSGRFYIGFELNLSWCFFLFVSIILSIPLIWKQKIGVLGLLLLAAVLLKPQLRPITPVETVKHFYENRKVALTGLVKKYSNEPNRKITTPELQQFDFEELHIIDGNYFFMVWDEDYPYPYGICHGEEEHLPTKIWGNTIDYNRLANGWYEFKYRFV